ncbi:MAG: AraC family transcriptional regulator ligand-binding domain-containing protein [Polyangiaceae bacterium]
MVRPLLEVAQSHGLSAAKLRESLISVSGDAPPEADVPIERVFQLWADVATQSQDVALPFRAAERLRLEALGLPGFAILTAASGRDAWTQALRYAPLLVTAGQWEATPSRFGMRVSWLRAGERWLGHRLANESGLAQFVVCLRQVYGNEFAPVRVQLRHAAPRSSSAHRAFFRCPVEFGAARDAFWFDERVFEKAPPLANSALSAFLSAQADARLRAHTDEANEAVAAQLRENLDRALCGDHASLEIGRCARALGLSERTLRRRLQAEGTTFRAVLGEARRAAVERLLEQRATSLTEVALHVGYSDSSAFARAARRWFGETASNRRALTRRRGS